MCPSRLVGGRHLRSFSEWHPLMHLTASCEGAKNKQGRPDLASPSHASLANAILARRILVAIEAAYVVRQWF